MSAARGIHDAGHAPADRRRAAAQRVHSDLQHWSARGGAACAARADVVHRSAARNGYSAATLVAVHNKLLAARRLLRDGLLCVIADTNRNVFGFFVRRRQRRDGVGRRPAAPGRRQGVVGVDGAVEQELQKQQHLAPRAA